MRIGPSDRLIIALTVLLIGAIAVPHLPPGICYGDSGDLQLASATLGITHPPGYGVYASLGYLFTLVPDVCPAYMVSLACMASGLLALLLCILMQVRLGAVPALACAVAVGLTALDRIWYNLVAPEVYMPTLAFQMGSAYMLIKYAHTGQHRHSLIAAVLFGVAFASRPPVLLALPFFLAGWWLAGERRRLSWPRSIQSLAVAGGLMMLPVIYSLGYVWVRDTPQTPYNYIEVHNTDHQDMPESSAGLQAKLERVVWHATARQFQGLTGYTSAELRLKLRWLREDLLANRPITLTFAFVLVFLGALIAYRRSPVSVWVLGGSAVSSVAYVFVYRIYGQAADLLPLLFGVGVFGGVAVSAVCPKRSKRVRRLGGTAVLAAVALLTVRGVPHRPATGRNADAERCVRGADVSTLPPNSVICTGWGASAPLRYALLFHSGRRDIDIVSISIRKWKQAVERHPRRPAFTTAHPGTWPGFTITPYRNLFRVEALRTDGGIKPNPKR